MVGCSVKRAGEVEWEILRGEICSGREGIGGQFSKKRKRGGFGGKEDVGDF